MSKQHKRRQHRHVARQPRPTTPFTPVPVRARHDGWTPAKQIAFINAFAASGCIAEACRHVGMSKQSAYDLYNRRDAGSLRQAWDSARTQAANRLADAVVGRALNGVATPIFFQGEQIGQRIRYDDRLAMWLLSHLAPDRFGAWRNSHAFHRKDPDGAAKTLIHMLQCLAEDLVADRAGEPRVRRDAVAFERFAAPDDAEREDKRNDFMGRLLRQIEEEAFQRRLAEIERGEQRPGQPEGDAASSWSSSGPDAPPSGVERNDLSPLRVPDSNLG